MKEKRMGKSKEQIAQETKDKQELLEQKTFAQEFIIPIFKKYNLTAYQSGQIFEVMKQVSLGKMNQAWADKKMSELGLAEELTDDKSAKDTDIYADLIEAIKDQPISKTMKLWEILERLIDMYGQRQVLQIRFDELPIDEMMK